MGHYTGKALTDGDKNVLLGTFAGDSLTTGCCNVLIGYNVDAASGSDKTFKIGHSTDWWICGDSSFNVYDKDGNKFGFNPDSQQNLYAGTCAGACSDADTTYNIGIGYSAGYTLDSGDQNILLGTNAGRDLSSGAYNILFGHHFTIIIIWN